MFFGKKSGNWWNFFDEAPASTKEYYEKGIFPHLSFQWGEDHPKYGLMRYRDYTFDAPGAFTREELEGMILAPLHSAEITKKIGTTNKIELIQSLTVILLSMSNSLISMFCFRASIVTLENRLK